MRRKYTKPSMSIDMFEANEYIAACWKINCNVPRGYGYIDRNGNGKYDGRDKKLTTDNVSGCGTWHKGVEGVPGDGPTGNSMWHPSSGENDYPVYYWRDGYGFYDIHFSKASDAQWESNPNAS